MVHPNGIPTTGLDEIYKNQVEHDPSDLQSANRLAEFGEKIRLGLFYQNESLPVYEEVRSEHLQSADRKIELLNEELDRYAV
jgi:hypothetical protein